MGYSLVVFDWDGTLMDSTHSIVAAKCGGLPRSGPACAVGVVGQLGDRPVAGSALRQAVPELTQAMVPRFLEPLPDPLP